MVKWKHAQEYFPQQELEYINDILVQIVTEEMEDQLRIIRTTNPLFVHNVDAENQSDNTASSSSSLPKARTNFVESNIWNKNDLVKQWLNNHKEQ